MQDTTPATPRLFQLRCLPTGISRVKVVAATATHSDAALDSDSY